MSHMRPQAGDQCEYDDGHSGRCRPIGYRQHKRAYSARYGLSPLGKAARYRYERTSSGRTSHIKYITTTGRINSCRLSAQRRARKLGAEGTATVAQIAARWAMWGGKCWMCDDIATATDHVKPLALGGANWPSNQRPICTSHNSIKGATLYSPIAIMHLGMNPLTLTVQ